MEERKVAKCFKSYLTAKKYYDTDLDKSFEYFKQCIAILTDIKDNKIKIDSKFAEVIEETETECSKYLTKAIEMTIDKPFTQKIVLQDSDKELFKIIEEGRFKDLKKYNYGEINFNVYNNNGNTPLHMAITFGDTSYIKQALRLGATIDMTNKGGFTLLEYACLQQDPNLINFLMLYGADMRKHLLFRDGKKYRTSGNQIDIMLLEKAILEDLTQSKYKQPQYLGFVFDKLNKNDPIDIQYNDNTEIITIENLITKLDHIIANFPEEYRNTYLDMLKEEFEYDLHNKLGCPNNMIEVVLYYIVPFINYGYLKLNWLLSIEIKYLILKVLKNKVKINTNELKSELREILIKIYLEPQIISDGMIQTIVLQWMNKIKV